MKKRSAILVKLGENLKFLRRGKGLRQHELAEMLEVKANTISNYEHGKSYPDYDTLLRLADFFEVAVGDFITVDLARKKGSKYPDGERNKRAPAEGEGSYMKKTLDLRDILRREDLRVISVEADMMTPALKSGDWAIGIPVRDFTTLRPNLVYALYTRQEELFVGYLEYVEKGQKIRMSANIKVAAGHLDISVEEIKEICQIRFKLTSQFEGINKVDRIGNMEAMVKEIYHKI